MSKQNTIQAAFHALIWALMSCFLAGCLSNVEVPKTDMSTGSKSEPLFIPKVMADLDIKQQPSALTTQWTQPVRLENAKLRTLARLQWKADADLIIEPKYSVTSDEKEMSVTVTGYAAKYKNVRNMADADHKRLQRAELLKSKFTTLTYDSASSVSSTPEQAVSATPLLVGGGIVLGLILLLVATGN